MPDDLKQRIAAMKAKQKERWQEFNKAGQDYGSVGFSVGALLEDIDNAVAELERLERENRNLEEHVKDRDSLLSCGLVDCPTRND